MEDTNYFDAMLRIVDGLNRKFPAGNVPFQTIARLCEEAGELAEEVNHFEGSGVKVEKYGTLIGRGSRPRFETPSVRP